MHRIPYLLVLLFLIGSGAAAQSVDTSAIARATATTRPPQLSRRKMEELRRRPDIIEGRDLNEKTMWLARGNYVGMTVLTAADEQTTYVVVRRKTSSQPEWHARWDDIVVFRAGTGVVVFGDSLVGSTLRAPGERRGGTFTKNFQIVVKPGDVVRIPAAVPHAFVVSGTDALEYLVIKVRRQELPIRWTTERDLLSSGP